jgi:putative NADH-flavin reductase
MFQLLIIGANGGIGRQCVEQALAKGYQVTAIVRNPSKLPLKHPSLQIVRGDVMQSFHFSNHFKGKDAIISTIGVSGGFGNDRPTTLYSQGALNIMTEMQQAGTRRVFFISASAVETSPLLPPFVRFISKYIVQKLLKHMYADLLLMEKEIKKTGLDWTILRPPRLTDRPATGQYRIAVNRFLKNGLKISRADVAHFILTHLQTTEMYQSTVEIAY